MVRHCAKTKSIAPNGEVHMQGTMRPMATAALCALLGTPGQEGAGQVTLRCDTRHPAPGLAHA
eukprot:5274252-Alexandrium_andersonii.AAC.1